MRPLMLAAALFSFSWVLAVVSRFSIVVLIAPSALGFLLMLVHVRSMVCSKREVVEVSALLMLAWFATLFSMQLAGRGVFTKYVLRLDHIIYLFSGALIYGVVLSGFGVIFGKRRAKCG